MDTKLARIQSLILEEGLRWKGQQEISGNKGFKDEIFQEAMESVEWQVGQAWCALFGKLVWWNAYKKYNQELADRVFELFDPSAVATWRSFKRSKDFATGTHPDYGALMIFQTYKIIKDKLTPYWTGHLVLVLDPFRVVKDITEAKRKIDEDSAFDVETLEGNANSMGGREGIEVADLERSVDYNRRVGLNLLGFVYPRV